MGIGNMIKSAVDSVRNMLGTDCTLNSTTPLGKCSYSELSQEQIRETLGEDWADQFNMPWVMIEVPAGNNVKEGDKITVILTGTDWVVRRVMDAQAGGVKIAQRCICVGQLL